MRGKVVALEMVVTITLRSGHMSGHATKSGLTCVALNFTGNLPPDLSTRAKQHAATAKSAKLWRPPLEVPLGASTVT